MFKKIIMSLLLLFSIVQYASAQLQPFVLNVEATNETCTGNGTITMQAANTAVGAIITFNTFQLPNLTTPIASQTTPTLTGLVHGDYRIVATQKLDSELNTQTQDITIFDATSPLVYTVSGTNSQCVTGGSIIVTIVSGNAVQYEIFAGPVIRPLQNSNIFENLPAGTYQIRVFDNCGEALVKTYILFSDFPELEITPSTITPGALPQCGSIIVSNTITISGEGVIPYPITFTYTVFPPDGSPSIQIVKIITSGTEVSAIIPFYNGQPYEYTVSTTGICGNILTTSGTIDREISVKQSSVPDECEEFILELNVQNFVAPYTLTFLAAPDQFNPSSYYSQFPIFSSPSLNFGSAANPILGGLYKVQITDACGNIAFDEIDLVQPIIIPIVKIKPEPGCTSSFADVSITIPTRNIVSAVMMSAPSEANLSLPANMMSYYNASTSTLAMTHLIAGEYIIKLIDDCGKEYIVPFKVLNITTSSIGKFTRPDCSGNTGSILLRGNFGVSIVSAQIVEAPTQFSPTLPYIVSSFLDAEGVLLVTDLPPGSYTFSLTDNCGKDHMVTVVAEGMIVTQDILDITRFCGSFKLQYTHKSNTIFYQKFWLQRLDPVTNTWGHPQTTVEYPEGTEPTVANSIAVVNGTTVYNINTFGEFRILKVYESYGNFENPEANKCFAVTRTFSINENFSIREIIKISCDGSSSDIKIVTDGVAPLIFKIIEKNGIPYLIDNGNSNIFADLEPAIYKFQVQQACGNIVTQVVDVAHLPEPFFIEKPEDMIACDDADMDNQVLFDLSLQNAAAVGAQDEVDFLISYHTSIANAETGTNALPLQYLSGTKTIYVRLRALIGECYKTTSFKLTVRPYPKLNMSLDYALCEGSPITITADAGMTSYLWSTGETTQSIVVSEIGAYSLEVQREYGTEITCSAVYNIVVANTTTPIISDVVISDWTSNDNSFSVILQSGNPAHYLYSLDNITFQADNSFYGLPAGSYQVYVKNIYGCGDAKKIVHLLNYPHFFTPNGDGYNDTWHINLAKSEPNIKVFIFDRYGKLVKQLLSKDFGWDGTLNGKRLPSTDYWFMVQRQDGQEFRGHFTLKR